MHLKQMLMVENVLFYISSTNTNVVLPCYCMLLGAQNWCALVHERVAAYCARALDKDREKDGESKRKRDSEGVLRRYLSASDREDSPGGRSQPFSTENDT